MGKTRYYCEYCGAQVRETDKLCPKCARFFTAVKCPKCGHSGDAAEFASGCPACGYCAQGPLEEFYLDGGKGRRGESSPSPLSRWAYAIGGILIALAMVAAFFLLSR
jgi:hypothetical protein